jgi:peroxiredoxin
MRSPIALVSICLIMVIAGCHFGVRNPESHIRGKVNGITNTRVFLNELDVNSAKILDSAEISGQGSFEFSFANDSTGIFALQFEDGPVITLIMHAGDTIDIEIDLAGSPYSFISGGNMESEWMSDFENHAYANLHKIDSLRILFEQSRDDPGFYAIRSLIDQAYQDILIDQKLFARDFIEKHPGSMASLVVLNRNFKQIEIFDRKDDFKYYNLLDSNLMLNYPGNKHAINHHEITNKLREEMRKDAQAASRLSPGNEAPDITLQGWNGQAYQLSDLRGHWVVIYFWAAWDARSRQVNHELKAFFETYQDRGVEVYAVSLDENDDIWKAAIKLDELKWIHVSDLKGLDSPVMSLFHVPDKLPYFYLLDQDGVIRYKGHNYGELEELLLAYLGVKS